MKITMSEQVGIGNFAGDTDEEQENAANNYARILEERLTAYCAENWPNAELRFDLSVENVSGCTRDFDVYVDDEEYNNGIDTSIERGIKWQYEVICSDMERSGEIYE